MQILGDWESLSLGGLNYGYTSPLATTWIWKERKGEEESAMSPGIWLK